MCSRLYFAKFEYRKSHITNTIHFLGFPIFRGFPDDSEKNDCHIRIQDNISSNLEENFGNSCDVRKSAVLLGKL